MSIRIEITDVTNEDRASLVKLAKYLLESAGHQMVYQMPKENLKPIPPEGVTPETTVAPVKESEELVEFYNAEIGKMEKITKKELVKKIIKHDEDRSERIMDVIEKALDKPKRKKSTSDIGKEIAKTNEDIMTEVAIPPYGHCAVPTPPISPINFNTFMTKITGLRADGKITDLELLNIVRSHGLDRTHKLSTNPELVPLVNADVDKFVEGK